MQSRIRNQRRRRNESLALPDRLCVERGTWSGVQTANADHTHTRPNVLFIFADDWGRHAGIYRELDGPGTMNDVVRTPHIDALAKQGVVFRSAFVSSPSCTPCRSALFSGQHFWRCGRGSILRGARWEDSQISFATRLHDAGYQLGISYKAWGPGVPNNAPMNAAEFKLTAGGAFNQFSQNASQRVAKGQNVETVKQRLAADATGNFTTMLKQRDPAKPFFYWFGPTNTIVLGLAAAAKPCGTSIPMICEASYHRF